MNGIIKNADIELYELLKGEETLQKTSINMIASDSLQDDVSLALSGSAFCNKTAVGLPGNQRLGGSEHADKLERLAAKRACEVFGAEHANMLPYSGTTANLCVYHALLSVGDTVVALDPEHGSHASHGRKGHISGEIYNFVHFGLDRKTQLFSYDALEAAVKESKPKLVVIGVSSYPRNIDYSKVASICHENGAYFMVDMAHTSGLVAAGVLENPVKWADVVTASATKTMCGCHTGYILCKSELKEAIDRGVYPGVTASMHLQTVAAVAYVMKKAQTEEFKALMQGIVRNAKALSDALSERGFGIVTGGTDCHMLTVDLRPFGIDGKTYLDRLEAVGISANTKSIPYDESKVAGGIRIGTIIPTQMGMDENDMYTIADIMKSIALSADEKTMSDCKNKVNALIEKCE